MGFEVAARRARRLAPSATGTARTQGVTARPRQKGTPQINRSRAAGLVAQAMVELGEEREHRKARVRRDALEADRREAEMHALQQSLRGKTRDQLQGMVYGPRQRTTMPDSAEARRHRERERRDRIPGSPPRAVSTGPLDAGLSSGSVAQSNRSIKAFGTRGLDAPGVPAGPVDKYRLVNGKRVPISTDETRGAAAAKAAREAARKAAYRANGWAHNGSTVSDDTVRASLPTNGDANHAPAYLTRELPRDKGKRSAAIRRRYGSECPVCGTHHRGICTE